MTMPLFSPCRLWHWSELQLQCLQCSTRWPWPLAAHFLSPRRVCCPVLSEMWVAPVMDNAGPGLRKACAHGSLSAGSDQHESNFHSLPNTEAVSVKPMLTGTPPLLGWAFEQGEWVVLLHACVWWIHTQGVNLLLHTEDSPAAVSPL
jgi:hypothetical protein